MSPRTNNKKVKKEKIQKPAAEKRKKVKSNLIPLPKKLMKDMGFVNQDGMVMVDRTKLKDIKSFNRPKEEFAEKPKETKEPPKRQKVQMVETVDRVKEKQDAKRLEDIGVY